MWWMLRREPGSSASGDAVSGEEAKAENQHHDCAADESCVDQQALVAADAEDHDGQPVVMSMEAGSSAATIRAVSASSRSKQA